MNPSAGIASFLEGFSLARHPGLRRYTWLPVGISLVVCVTGLYFAFDYLIDVTNRFIAGLPEWLSWLDLLLKPLLYITGVLGGAWLFGLLAVLIASPFLGAFSMALERLRYGSAPESDTAIWTDISMSLAREGRKILYHLPRLLLVFLLTLIPVINLAAPVIWLLFGAWTMAVQFVDYPTENRQQPFQDHAVQAQSQPCGSLGLWPLRHWRADDPAAEFSADTRGGRRRHGSVANAGDQHSAVVPLRVANDPRQSFLQPIQALGEADPEVRVVVRAKGVAGRDAHILFGQHTFGEGHAVGAALHLRKGVERTRR